MCANIHIKKKEENKESQASWEDSSRSGGLTLEKPDEVVN